jgi:hypothetical protein
MALPELPVSSQRFTIINPLELNSGEMGSKGYRIGRRQGVGRAFSLGKTYPPALIAEHSNRT